MPPKTQGSTPPTTPQIGGSLIPTLKSLAEYEPSDEIKKAVASYHAVGQVPPAPHAGSVSGPGKPTH